jgi:hypothetical protein
MQIQAKNAKYQTLINTLEDEGWPKNAKYQILINTLEDEGWLVHLMITIAGVRLRP